MIDSEEILREFNARMEHLAKNTTNDSKEFLHAFEWGGKLMLSVCLKSIRKQHDSNDKTHYKDITKAQLRVLREKIKDKKWSGADYEGVDDRQREMMNKWNDDIDEIDCLFAELVVSESVREENIE